MLFLSLKNVDGFTFGGCEISSDRAGGQRSILGKTISIFDKKARDGEKEIFYHGILLGLLRSDPNWLVQSNVEFGDGFADILMEPEVYGCRGSLLN